jgi:MFS family permease
MVGGMNRIGNFIGPVVGGYLGQHVGLESAFYAQAVMGLGAAAMMFLVVREGSGAEDLTGRGLGHRLLQTTIEHRGVFLRAGLPVMTLSLLRQARQVFMPLWGDEIGLDVSQIGLLTSISYLVDAAVFYPSGWIMDSLGRKWAGVPCLAILALGLLILPLTHDFASFTIVAVLTGVGNGFGSGINMTLGADFAPEDRRGEFLGVWRLVSDVGQAGGPLVIGVLTGIGSLAIASAASGGIGVLGTAALLLFVPETLRRGRPLAIDEIALADAASVEGGR